MVCVCVYCTDCILSIQLSVGGHLGGFYLLALVNDTAVKVGYNYFFKTLLSVFLDKFPKVGFLGRVVVLCLSFVSPQWPCRFAFLPTVARVQLLHVLTNPFWFFHSNPPSGCEVLSYCCCLVLYGLHAKNGFSISK